MNLGKAFQYPFEDREWASKIGLGALISLVPILNFAMLGYILEVMRRVQHSDPTPLPGWDDLGKKFMDGLMLFLAGFVYALPVIILVGIPMALIAIPAAVAANSNSQGVANAVATAGGFVGLCLSCILILYGIALSIVFPAIYLEYAAKGTFGACFRTSSGSGFSGATHHTDAAYTFGEPSSNPFQAQQPRHNGETTDSHRRGA